MPKQEGQKTKLLALLHIFEQKTDENHLLNVPQLVELLEQQGILAERKSIYSDIDTLCALGYDIQLRRGRGGGYWMASRAFELSELKLLVDAVQASKVISARTSKKLIRKLEALCSEYEGTQLQRQVYVDGRPKADSRTLLYSIDALHTAISAGRLVQFRYKNNSTWTVSPWQLAWEGGCYYLIAYQDEKDPANIRNYRVDRMSYVKVLDRPRRGKEAFAAFDLPSYLRKHFNMFGGPEYRVTLRCTADLEAAAEIVDLANEKMDNQFRENVVFTLADHIDFSVQRYRKNINIKLPLFYEVRQLYPKESEIGKQALNILKKRLDIALPQEEAAAIALHFVNYKAQAETTPDIDYGSIIEQATGIIEQELQVTVDRDSFNYYRFVTHMHYMMKRTLDDAMIDTQNRDIFESMKKEYPSIYSCSVKVAALIEQQLKKSLSEEEILYLILHINRLCAREDCDR